MKTTCELNSSDSGFIKFTTHVSDMSHIVCGCIVLLLIPYLCRSEMVAVHKLLKKYTKIYLPGCEIDLGATLTRKNLHSEELGETAADKVFNSASASCINVGVHTCTQYNACKDRHACTSASVLHDVWSYNPLQPYTHFGLPHKIVMLLQLH